MALRPGQDYSTHPVFSPPLLPVSRLPLNTVLPAGPWRGAIAKATNSCYPCRCRGTGQQRQWTLKRCASFSSFASCFLTRSQRKTADRGTVPPSSRGGLPAVAVLMWESVSSRAAPTGQFVLWHLAFQAGDRPRRACWSRRRRTGVGWTSSSSRRCPGSSSRLYYVFGPTPGSTPRCVVRCHGLEYKYTLCSLHLSLASDA